MLSVSTFRVDGEVRKVAAIASIMFLKTFQEYFVCATTIEFVTETGSISVKFRQNSPGPWNFDSKM